MIQQILYTLGFTTAFVGLLYTSELLYQKLHVRAEITRKIAHTAATLFSLVFLLTFQSYIYVLVLGLIFFLLLFVARKLKWLQSIDAVKRSTAGSYLLPVSICLLFIFYMETQNSLLFVLPILTLGISDPLAGLSGTLLRHKTRPIVLFGWQLDKTILGSTVFFVATWIIAFSVLNFHGYAAGSVLWIATCLAGLGTLVEMLSTRGLDNLTVPLALSLALYLLTVT